MRLPQDRILHIDTELKDGKVNIVAEWRGELVRCKECKHWDTADGECYGHDYYYCSEENDYCSHGERKVP